MERSLIERLEAAVAHLESLPIGSLAGISSRDLAVDSSSDPAVIAFDDFVEKSLGRVLAAAEKIGGKILEATKIVEEAFAAEKDLLVKSKQCQVLVEYKNKDPSHIEWAKAMKDLYLPGLRDYVKAFYPLGLVWGTGGVISSAPAVSASSVKAPAGRGAAPPPPPPSNLFGSETTPSTKPKQGMSAVFQEISSGKPVTAGLRKVTDDMKTKNRTDRTGVVNAAEKESRSSSSSFSKAGPPKLELQMGRKWAVENQIGKKNLIIDECDSRQSVYVFGCKDSVLQIKGKVNNITIDKCTKMGLVFSDVVAACEIVNCNGAEVQCQGSVPTISIDNTGGCQLYLSKDSLQASITTAKSSEINVLVPGDGADSDWGGNFSKSSQSAPFFSSTLRASSSPFLFHIFTNIPHSPDNSEMHRRRLLTIFALLQIFFTFASSQPFIGVNYGEVADNLPPPSATAKLLQSTSISKVRLYNADPNFIQALAGTNISIVIGTSNADIPSLASDPSFASQWVSSNVAPFVPRSAILVISVGNEILNSSNPSLYPQLLPAMQNLQAALPPNSNIKVSTVHKMAIMSASDPPSSGAFHSDLLPFINPILQFLSQSGGPFMINPYPYFAYRDDPRPETLAYCLFQPNPGRMDPNTKITYTNMFDAQVDAIKSALNSAGFGTVEIVVAETGWPYKGDDSEVGATVENAAAYNGNLIKHLKSMVGTPLMPGKSVDTYIFELYDEDLKPGPTSERSFGLYRTDSTMIYDVGLTKSRSSQVSPPVNPPSSPTAPNNPSQPQPAVDCRVQTGTDCHVPSSVGPQTVNLVYQISATFALNQLFRSIFSRTLGFFSLSLLFHVSLPLLLLS